MSPSSHGFAVVDFETTGLIPERGDRAIEVGVVLVSPDGRIEHEDATLIHVSRDIGKQSLHHISAADLMRAPGFDAVARGLRDYLDGRVFVAHNVAFDSRVLRCEYARLGYDIPLDERNSLCTLRMGNKLLGMRSLESCCEHFGISNDDAHSALSDAHATALLLRRYMDMTPDWNGWSARIETAATIPWPAISQTPAQWMPRSASRADESDGTRPDGFLTRLADATPGSPKDGAEAEYMDLLDRCLIDQRLSEHERIALVEMARSLNLDRSACARIHDDYFAALAQTAWDDGMLSAYERDQLSTVGTLLGIAPEHIAYAIAPDDVSAPHGRHAATDATRADGTIRKENGRTVATPSRNPLQFTLRAGDRIVLTGDMACPRSEWVELLETLGIVVWPSVTKKVKLVVAADPDSESGKARKAREYGIPIVGEDWLERAVANGIDA